VEKLLEQEEIEGDEFRTIVAQFTTVPDKGSGVVRVNPKTPPVTA
jgi:hypothetical protein